MNVNFTTHNDRIYLFHPSILIDKLIFNDASCWEITYISDSSNSDIMQIAKWIAKNSTAKWIAKKLQRKHAEGIEIWAIDFGQ